MMTATRTRGLLARCRSCTAQSGQEAPTFMTTPTPPSFHTVADVRAQPRRFLDHLFQTAVTRALPLANTARFLPEPPTTGSGGRTMVIGAGKAGGAMAQAVEALWPADALLEGLVVTRYHHVPPRPQGLARRIEVVEASHPVPDAAGEAAAARILAMVQGLSANDLVLCLISGGGSSLLALPAEGLSLGGVPAQGTGTVVVRGK